MAAVAAEDAGFGDVWVAEHHFMSYGICPSAITPGEVKATCNGASAAGSPPASCMGHGAVLEEPAASDITGPREAEFRATPSTTRKATKVVTRAAAGVNGVAPPCRGRHPRTVMPDQSGRRRAAR